MSLWFTVCSKVRKTVEVKQSEFILSIWAWGHCLNQWNSISPLRSLYFTPLDDLRWEFINLSKKVHWRYVKIVKCLDTYTPSCFTSIFTIKICAINYLLETLIISINMWSAFFLRKTSTPSRILENVVIQQKTLPQNSLVFSPPPRRPSPGGRAKQFWATGIGDPKHLAFLNIPQTNSPNFTNLKKPGGRPFWDVTLWMFCATKCIPPGGWIRPHQGGFTLVFGT